MECPNCGKNFIRCTDGTLVDWEEFKKPREIENDIQKLVKIIQLMQQPYNQYRNTHGLAVTSVGDIHAK